VNIEVGFPADLVTHDAMVAFIFAVDQLVTQFEILHENDGSRVIHNVLQTLFAIA